MSFEDQLKEWVVIDDKLRIMYENMKELRLRRTNLTTSIQNNWNSNRIQNNKFPIVDGHIKLVNTRINEPLTFAYIDKSLRQIIKNEQQVQLIIEHIKNSRNSKTITELKRF